MKCFMGLGWLIGFEVCRPSLYMWWGNIQFFITQYTGHFMSLLLYIKYQRFKCPTASINHIFILFYSITQQNARHILNQSRSVLVRLPRTKNVMQVRYFQLSNLILVTVVLFDWQATERYDSIKKCSLTVWFDSPLQTKYTPCSWHYIILTRRKVVDKKKKTDINTQKWISQWNDKTKTDSDKLHCHLAAVDFDKQLHYINIQSTSHPCLCFGANFIWLLFLLWIWKVTSSFLIKPVKFGFVHWFSSRAAWWHRN